LTDEDQHRQLPVGQEWFHVFHIHTYTTSKQTMPGEHSKLAPFLHTGRQLSERKGGRLQEDVQVKRVFLLAVLLAGVVGCGKVEDQMVAGAYKGYFGDESGSKVGVEAILTQTGNQVTGEPLVSFVTRNQNQFATKCKLEGTVKGDEVKLKLQGQDEPMEIEVDAKHISKEGYFAIEGSAKIVSGTGKIANQIRSVARDGNLHFQIKTEAGVTEKKN
jgi:hypothetical protein